jgi:hypothetical protein
MAPVYDVLANLIAFSCAAAASVLLGHRAAALLSGLAVACWLLPARRTLLAQRVGLRSRGGTAAGAQRRA